MREARSILQSVARPAAIALLVLGCIIFIWRGPVRALGPHGSGDFVLVYSSARAWLQARNPYEAADVSLAWTSGGGPADRDPMLTRTAEVLLYPPTALVALAPLAALPWRAALLVWTAINVACAAAALWGVAALAGLSGRGRGRGGGDGRVRTPALWWFLAGGVWLAPAHTCIAHGQTAVLVVGLVVLSQVARVLGGNGGGPGKMFLAGGLLGLGAAIKPQLAGLFVVYEAGRLRWRPVAAAVVVAAALALAGVWRMEAAGLSWRESWTRNVTEFAARGDGSPIAANEIRYQLVNLHYPLHTLIQDRDVVRWGVYGIAAGLCLAYAAVDLRRRQRARGQDLPHGGEGPGELVSLSMVAAVTLLVVYHRFYDAAILILPLGMAISGIAQDRRDLGRWAALALVMLFAAPGAVILTEAAKRGWVPARLAATGVWEHVVLPHQPWGILLMAGLLIWLRARAGPAGTGQ